MKIIELAHALGEEIAASAEIEKLNSAKAAFDDDAALQEKMQEYNAQRALLGGEFSKDPDKQDQVALADIKARMDELSSEIAGNERYIAFLNAKKALDELMNKVNEEITFCITGERPSSCTHDCSTCSGCH